jgi:hypothetical protein
VGYWLRKLEWLEVSLEMGRGMVFARDFEVDLEHLARS